MIRGEKRENRGCRSRSGRWRVEVKVQRAEALTARLAVAIALPGPDAILEAACKAHRPGVLFQMHDGLT